MNKFDEFIEAADKDLKVDTSTRVSSGSLTPPGMLSPNSLVSGNSVSRKRESHPQEGTKTYGQSRQFTPQRLSHQDHPLKDAAGQPQNAAVAARNANGLNKRRSLIQPIVAPKTPERHAKYNVSAPTTLVADRSSQAKTESKATKRSSAADADGMMSTLLQNLANKELEILDAKQRIEELKKQLASEDTQYQERLKDLQELREKVSYHFHRAAISNSPQPAANAKAKAEVKSSEPAKVRQNRAATPPVNKVSTPNTALPKEDKQSVWSKSLAMFNQFDQIIQHELERSLNWDEHPSPATREEAHQQDETAVRSKKQTEEPGGVTKSLWNFVSDMKSGLLGIDEESESRQQSDSAGSDEVVGLGIRTSDSPTVNDNKLKFVGGELSAEEDGINKEVEMNDFRTT